MAGSSESEKEIIPLNEETQIALPSQDGNERRLALPVIIPSFNLNEGNFDRANFGPQTNSTHTEANTIEYAKITHVHHHYGGDKSQESPSTSGATGARPRRKPVKGFVQITDDIFMNTKKPLKKGLKIYEGYQEHVTGQRQPLAIKAIVPCTEKSIREVQHLVKLAPHPNVVRIISSKEEETPLPILYIAMELCGSKNLQDYLNENREKNTPFDFKKTMSYSKRLVEAIKHIHRNRIIHGDLKPENILLSLDRHQIKVSDFGISKDLRQSRSSTKLTSQGTDGYRAPETYSSEVISMMADIFSLGVTLYSLWTNGKHPFGENPYQRVVNIITNADRDLSGLPEEMGAKKDEFLDLLDQMLAFDPENRPIIEEITIHPFLSGKLAARASRQLRDPQILSTLDNMSVATKPTTSSRRKANGDDKDQNNNNSATTAENQSVLPVKIAKLNLSWTHKYVSPDCIIHGKNFDQHLQNLLQPSERRVIRQAFGAYVANKNMPELLRQVDSALDRRDKWPIWYFVVESMKDDQRDCCRIQLGQLFRAKQIA